MVLQYFKIYIYTTGCVTHSVSWLLLETVEWRGRGPEEDPHFSGKGGATSLQSLYTIQTQTWLFIEYQ